MVRLPPQCPERLIGQLTHGDSGACVHAHIGVALRIAGANVEHGMFWVLPVDPVSRAVDDRTAAIGTAKLAVVDSLSFSCLSIHKVLRLLK